MNQYVFILGPIIRMHPIMRIYKNVVCYGKSSKIKNVKMSQKCPLQKIIVLVDG